MKSKQTTLSRRRFCTWLASTALAASLPALSGCSAFEPIPFNTGATVPAPNGCRELLARDPRGDC